MADDLNKQLGIQQQINKVLSQRTAVLDAQANLIAGQAKMARELCKAMDCADLDGMEERIAGISAGMKSAAEEAGKMGETTSEALSEASDNAETTSSKLGAMSKHLTTGKAAAAGFGVGAIAAFKGAGEQLKGMFRMLGSVTKGFYSIGASIVAIPFKMLGGLIKQANALHGSLSPLILAMEEVRKNFGDLASGPGKDITDTFRAVRAEGSDLAGTGLSVGQVFGPGPEGAALALKYVSEQATGMGASFYGAREEIKQMGGAFVAYTKGLGLSGEQTGALAKAAKATGKSLEDMLQETSNYALQMGEAFGMSGKQIAKDMADMTKDVATFGTLAPKELAQISVYARKLGIDIKDLQGVVNKFDNFEDAAKSASMLAQSFGMNVDAMAMMNEQDPAKRMDMLRKSFQDTGRSVNDLSRQELKLLASQMGLSEEAAKTALANEDMSYDDIIKQGDKAKDKTLSQAEAMEKLGKSIEKVFKSGSGANSFWEALTGGFMKGLTRSKEYREMLLNIRKSMREVYKGGKEIGKAFFQSFPGVKKMVTALRDMFDPKRVKEMMAKVVDAFKDFFKMVQTDPKAGMEMLGKRLKKIFGSFFSSKSGAGKAFVEGAKKFFGTILILLMNLVPILIKGLAKVINKIAAFISNPSAFAPASSGMGSAMKKAMIAAFESIKEAIPVLLGALVNLVKTIFKKHGGKIIAVGSALGAIVLGKMLLVMTLSALKGAVVMKMTQYFAKLFGASTEKASQQVGSGKSAKSLGKAMKSGFKGLAQGIKGFFETMARLKPTTILKAGISMALAGVVMGVSMIIFALAMVAVSKILSLVTFGQLVQGFVGLTMAAGALWLLMLVTAPLVADGGMTMGMAMLGMLAGALALAVGGVAFAIALVVVTKALASVNGKQAAMGMLVLAMAAVAMVALVIAGVLLATPLTLVAAGGLIMGAVLLAAVAAGFAATLNVVSQQVRSIKDPIGAALGFAMIAIVVASLAIMAVALTYGAPFFISGIIGLIPMVAFLGYMLMAVPIIGDVGNLLMSALKDPIGVAKGFASLALMFASLALMAAAATVAGALSIPGTIGLGLMIYFLAVLPAVVGFLNQSVKQVDSSGIDWAKASSSFLSLSAIFATLALLELAAVLAGALALFGFVGLGLMIYFLAVLPIVTSMIADVVAAGPKDPGKSSDMFWALTKIFGFMAILAVAAVVAGVLCFIGGFFLGGVGSFAEKLVEKVMPALQAFDKMGSGMNWDGISKKFDIIGKMFVVIGQAALLSLALLPFTMPWIGSILMGGFDAVKSFANKIADVFGPAIQAFDKVEMADPGAFESKINAIGIIFGIIGTLVDASIALAEIDLKAVKKGGESGAVLQGVSGMINALMGGLSSVLYAITDMIGSGMSESQIQSALAIGKLLESLGTLMQALMPSPEFFKAIKTTSRSFLGGSSESLKNAPKIIAAMKDMIGGMMETMKTALPPIIKAVLDAARGIKDPAAMKPKMEIVAMAMDIIGKFGKTMGDMFTVALKMEKDMPSGKKGAQKFYAAMHKMRVVIATVSNSLKHHMASIIGSVIASAELVKDPKTLEPKMKIMGMAMDMIAKFGDTIAKVGKLMESKEEPKATHATKMRRMTKTISTIVGAVQEHMPPLIDKVIDIAKGIKNPRNVAYRMKVVESAMKAVASFADTIAKVASLAPEGGTIKGSVGPLIQDVIEVIGKAFDDTKDYNMASVISTIANSGISANARKMEASAKAMEQLGKFTGAYVDLTNAATQLTTEKSDLTATAIVQMITDYNEISTALNANPPVKLNAAINKFGRNLAITADTISVDNKPVNITVELNLTMDADAIATGLSKRTGRYRVALSRKAGAAVPGTTDYSGSQAGG